MLSLHLLQVSLVYVNTLMIQQVLAEPEWQNRLTEVDLRALSPLRWRHVNPYGTFTLNMQERLPLEQVQERVMGEDSLLERVTAAAKNASFRTIHSSRTNPPLH
jgi:hypothetical protein